MVSVVQNVAIDCADAYELARFWSEVTGCPLHPEDGPGDPETQVTLPEGPVLYFNQVPEPKVVKNRIHLCLRPETSREEEIERLLGLGAVLVADRRELDGGGGPSSRTPRAMSSVYCAARPTAPQRLPEAHAPRAGRGYVPAAGPARNATDGVRGRSFRSHAPRPASAAGRVHRLSRTPCRPQSWALPSLPGGRSAVARVPALTCNRSPACVSRHRSPACVSRRPAPILCVCQLPAGHSSGSL